MVSYNMENRISNIRLSTVVPATVTGEEKVHKLTNTDLVMKLHYLKGVYFFKSEAVQGLDILALKKPMFHWLEYYYPISGRVRRSEEEEEGRPLIKCNDSGVRVIEADCSTTLDEWLAMNDHSPNQHLTSDQVLGPDLGFSPLVYIQFTLFKCGGLSVGLSWAHVLGDIFSATAFINMWGQVNAGHMPPQSLTIFPNTRKYQFPPSISEKPLSLKRMDPVGDHWLTTNNSKMETHSFHFTPKQLNQTANNLQPFEFLSAIMWKSLAKIRGEKEPRIVTVCTNEAHERENNILSNGQVVSTVEADFMVAKAGVLELAKLIAEKTADERGMIEEIMERENGKSDFIVYGANLTFINLEDSNIYGLEMHGYKPVLANYTIEGVGDEGVVLVLPGPENGENEGGSGRTMTVVLPENQLVELKNELKNEWGFF